MAASLYVISRGLIIEPPAFLSQAVERSQRMAHRAASARLVRPAQ